MINRWIPVLIAATILSAGALWAAPVRKKAKATKAAKAAEDAPAESSLGSDSKSVDRKRFELYLKERLKKIKDAHQARIDFFAQEQGIWTSFWNKVRDERQLFETRITRQTLDLFESLASLDPKDYSTTIANFEKLQGDVIKSFETQQKGKMAEFFAARDARWKEFAADQEKERADFMADAEQSWQDNKKSLKDPETSVVEAPPARPAKSAKVEAAGDDEKQSDPLTEEEAKPAPKARTSPRAAPKAEKKARAMDAESNWH